MTVLSASPTASEDHVEILVAAILGPRTGEPSMGAVVIGNGIADIQAVRRFARQGLAAMQIRLIRDSAHHRDEERRHATYDASGVRRCRHAMDHLAAAHGVQQFILMGNCTLANICFNTALADPRVCGLVLTNPHVPVTPRLIFRLRRHLLRRDSWTRLLRGEMSPFQRRSSPASGPQLCKPRTDAWPYTRDLILPPNFDRQLEALATRRGLRSLIVFSHYESSLDYFRRFYRKVLERLEVRGLVRIVVLKTDHHDFSRSDESALALNDAISAWMAQSGPARSHTPEECCVS